jgi:hypothetical protein
MREGGIMSNENAEKKAVKLHTVWVCPKCGETVHEDRQYCDCHADLSGAKARISKNPPEIGRCNFETSRFSCNDCPEGCAWCASFGELVTNRAGFGGKDCLHHGGTARCYCCQSQIKLGFEIGQSISKIMGNITSEKLKAMANAIQEAREKLVLAQGEKAGKPWSA